MELIQSANLALRFVLELCALAALGYWGFKTGQGMLLKIVLGIGAPLLAALVWAIFVAPGSSRQLREPLLLVAEVVVFAAAAVALYAAGRPTLAWLLAAVFVINRALMYIWGQ